MLPHPGAPPALEGTTCRVLWVVGAAGHGGGGGSAPAFGAAVAVLPDGRRVAMAPDSEAAAAARLVGVLEAVATGARTGGPPRPPPLPPSHPDWQLAEHARLAADYRAARACVFERAAAGLRAQAALLSLQSP